MSSCAPELLHDHRALAGRRRAQWHGQPVAAFHRQFREPVVEVDGRHVGPGGCGKAFTGTPPWTDLTPDDVRRRWSRDPFYNLSRPDKSLLLLAPPAKSAGGLQRCGGPVFASASDSDYQRVPQAIRGTKAKLDEIKRFDMSGFRPRAEWVRAMRRYGILPADATPDLRIDVYAPECRYWESLWWVAKPKI